MNTGLRNELSILSGLMAFGFFLNGKSRWAAALGLASVGLKLFPEAGSSFRNRSVVITGGSRGLGLALAEQLVREGALVTLLARDHEELARAARQLEGLRGVPVLAIVCDVTDRLQLGSSFAKIKNHFGDIDILINNAGSVSAGPFEAMTSEDFQAQMNLHFFAPLVATQALVPFFKKKGAGHIVNINSIGGKITMPHMAPYCASKFALSGFSQCISAELAKDGIHVTTVYPGLMRTGSPIQAVFKGDHEKEFAWFALFDSMPGFSISAQYAARKILSAISLKQSHVVISLPAKLASFVQGNFPEIFRSGMIFANQFLPEGISHRRQTGAASRTWVNGKMWAKPFLGILKRAQARYNEHEKFDAGYNLNLSETR